MSERESALFSVCGVSVQALLVRTFAQWHTQRAHPHPHTHNAHTHTMHTKQVAAFPHYGGRWAEWNGHFRDTVRNFVKGMDGTAGAFAAAMCGSPNIYSDTNPGETEW